MADPNDEKADQQVGPDKPPRDGGDRDSADTEPNRTDELPVEPSDQYGPTTEYGGK
ncbi:MAG: hypothetical protein QOC66_2476 [Pseudonocardiales bacterium]|nr:hypothetical protein [Pseudonocardiales bacterium]